MVLQCLIQATLAAGLTCTSTAEQVGKQRYGAAEYGAAITALTDVELCTDGTAQELAEALRWRAESKASNGDQAGAIEAFALLWVVQPGYALDPLESPKFHELFSLGRTRAEKSKLVFARLVKTPGLDADVQVFDPKGRVKHVGVVFDSAKETWAAKKPDGAWDIAIPAGAVTATVLLESDEAVLFRSPRIRVTTFTPDAPPDPVPLTRRAPPPAESSKLPWVIAGSAIGAAVIIAVVVGVSVAVSSKKIDGSLGSVQLPLESSRP
jgi:hypothetical protein